MSSSVSRRRRVILFFVDILICILAVFTTYFIKSKINGNVFVYQEFYRNCLIMIGLSACLFLFLRTYNGFTEMTTFQYSLRIFKAVLIINILFFVLNRASLWYDRNFALITAKTLLVNSIMVFALLIIYRVIFKYILVMLKTLDNMIKG